MNRKSSLLIKENKIILASYCNNELEQLYAYKDEKIAVGNIYVARVQNVLPHMKAAFVEVEDHTTCYLPFSEMKQVTIKQGDSIVVQVIRERMKTKEPTVSTNLTFQGRYLVLTSENTKIGYSHKLSKDKKSMIQDVLQLDESREYGLIVRTDVNDLSTATLFLEELEQLKKRYEYIKSIQENRTVTSCLERSTPAYMRAILEHNNETHVVRTDNRALYEMIQQTLEACNSSIQLEWYADSYPLAKLLSLDTILSELLQKKVWLKCGGTLIIEPTEALTVIDVNSGKFQGKRSKEDTVLKVNQEAAIEIARQLKLRNLSGIIIIAFINMEKVNNQEEILRILKNEVAKDNVPTTVVGMTPLGLVEVTRKKVYASLMEQMNIF